MAKPLLLYDGGCNFCKRWILRWQARLADAADFEPYQTAAARFPDIPLEYFENAMQLVEADGRRVGGAAAAFKLFDLGGHRSKLWWCYRRLPGFAPVSEAVYRFVARHRTFFSRFF